ncbi:MAG TPA: phosphatase PAP2 family protein [Fulvivirga sp.]|nr:phosphatase PAP2 family protein [Fulvivirga sp.]
MRYSVLSLTLLLCPIGKTLCQNETNYTDYSTKNGETYRYERPKFFGFLLKVPKTIGIGVTRPFKSDNLWKTGAMIGSTTLLVAVDQPLIDGAQQFGRYINLSTNRDIKTLHEFKIFGQSAPIEVPATFSSGIYYIGEGWPSIATMLVFYTVGKIKKDYRSLQTASQLAQTMISVGILSQLIKHISGRESPFVSTRDGGEWRPLTSPSDYAENVPRYDAFPSGHFATLVGTFTVLQLNYPDSQLIKPLAVVLLGVVGYQMMNNGVHWFSDYPLAFAIGYGMGKLAVDDGRKNISASDSMRKGTKNWKFAPKYLGNGIGAMSLTYHIN